MIMKSWLFLCSVLLCGFAVLLTPIIEFTYYEMDLMHTVVATLLILSMYTCSVYTVFKSCN